MILSELEVCGVQSVGGVEMDQNGGEMETLYQNSRLPVGVTVWYFLCSLCI